MTLNPMLESIWNRKLYPTHALYPWIIWWQTPCGGWEEPSFRGLLDFFESGRLGKRHMSANACINSKVEGWGHPIFDYQHRLSDRKDWA